ncbi:LysR substrate-binding domain-containing protein [Mesobacterium sp. TK19101]|uniref:LysR substrate-binding domain-containing protein n=1 Tax=Mesobacterium hydrothermale TaxID=3111907 RepID=A0ABU6HI11_9RHOB|nr:LysR substrate-binding domain-containing protein [Mesobacterium sp. TK19101]MEC3862093.1 LysR substrate-binding domain-containing protein [Mesobacterium sp. TK19101]
MSRRHYDLPPLTTLSAFEAAARHLSFKNAAQEFSVTPGAVSHQVKALEGELGTVLFLRQHRGVALTPAGQDLYETLSTAFGQISRQLVRLRQNETDRAVAVGSTTAVAALWLSPALIEFWREFPEITIHQKTQDRPFEHLRDLDFFILYGPEPASDLDQVALYRDELVPVAAPALAQSLAGVSLPELAQNRLIHLQAPTKSWTTWTEWFRKLGHNGDVASAAQVTSYSVALQMARKGVGIALGWRRLVTPMLQTGKLSTIEIATVPAPEEFFLVSQPEADLSPNARKLKRWIVEASHQG